MKKMTNCCHPVNRWGAKYVRVIADDDTLSNDGDYPPGTETAGIHIASY